jgi:hypothetical protein
MPRGLSCDDARHRVLPATHVPMKLTDGQIESLKWIGLASMFVDHFGRLLLGHPDDGWVFALGRLAFPLFALVLALNLAREGDRVARAWRTARRLALWCLVAVPPSIWARGEPMLVNVLGTLALGALLCVLVAMRGQVVVRLVACGAVAFASWHVEFGTPGVFLIPAIFLWATERQWEAAALAALLLLLTGWLNAMFGGAAAFLATLATVPIAYAVSRLDWRVARYQFAFYLVYPAHLALIGALKATW